MMIEAVPFFHILVNIIQSEVGDDVSVECLSSGEVADVMFSAPPSSRPPWSASLSAPSLLVCLGRFGSRPETDES